MTSRRPGQVSDTEALLRSLGEIASEWAQERRQRQQRRNLDPADFDRLSDAGYPLFGVPEAMGGLWRDLARTTRPLSEALRTLAAGDSSVALVSAMHPLVLSAWLANPAAPLDSAAAWQAQSRYIYQTVLDGAWWGTIVSEPGSGGDTAKTASLARRAADGGYVMSGQKHFGSGSGITSFMQTAAVPEGEDDRDTFFLDVRGVPWDGSTGMKLISEWDGHGMTATQSHAFELTDFPATRLAAPGRAALPALINCCFTAVIVGIVQTAVAVAKQQVGRKRATLRAYERVEWANVEMEAWLIDQAYEGMLRTVEESRPGANLALNQGKAAIAGLAESLMTRVCRVAGGASFGRQSPLGFWFEDVRALGFLRPPWGLAYDTLFDAAWPDDAPPPAAR